jgi:hypothetical protein
MGAARVDDEGQAISIPTVSVWTWCVNPSSGAQRERRKADVTV